MTESILSHADPCPFCRSDQLWVWDKGVPGRFAVACSNPACAATGPMASSLAAAVVNWNRAPRQGSARSNAALSRALDEAHDPFR